MYNGEKRHLKENVIEIVVYKDEPIEPGCDYYLQITSVIKCFLWTPWYIERLFKHIEKQKKKRFRKIFDQVEEETYTFLRIKLVGKHGTVLKFGIMDIKPVEDNDEMYLLH